jgi:hypothetical protein
MSDSLPFEISDSETIVRVVKHGYHTNQNGKLTWHVFKPKAGENEVSVIRQLLGNDNCKSAGVRICSNENPSKYIGFAAILAKSIRDAGSEVVDSRDEFLGHADLRHNIAPLQDDEPSDGDATRKIRDRCKKLFESTKFTKDTEVDNPKWVASDLKLTA